MSENFPIRPGDSVAERSRLLLMSQRLPARLNSGQVAMLLGFAEHDIPILTKAKLLSPLGKPQANAVKYFARVEVEMLAIDTKWLTRATAALYEHWRQRPKAPISTRDSAGPSI
jgi:hypothetical protein